jgi:ribosomal protein S18 acetylase RimI-like enzyme
MKTMTEEADLLGLLSYLEATEGARHLYEKFGFRIVGTVKGDYTKWGGPLEHVNYLMERIPIVQDR